MCGIVGFYTPNQFQELRQALPNALARLAHRGPDDSGIYLDDVNGIGLGHRRLSILDLSAAGRQPMTDHTGSVRIVYNGEIYNFKELRDILFALGHKFNTETDTEVILAAYNQWGMACLDHFVGMFAFALWDNKKHGLYLVRDRLGIKPLYYYLRKGTLLFASELSALGEFKAFATSIDPDAATLFLHYQYIPAPKTVFQHTYKLLPGQYAFFDGRRLTQQTYWEIPMSGSSVEMGEPEALHTLASLLSRAVSQRLVGDVPIGALLSSGVDSSLVAALMQQACSEPIRTFCIGFDAHEYDEAPWAAKIAAHLGTNHTQLYVGPKDVLDVIPDLPNIYNEPFADPSAMPTYLVSRLARHHVSVALSGDGGDEQFCGYVRYWSTCAAEMLGRIPAPVGQAASMLLGAIPANPVETVYIRLRDHLPQRFRMANFRDKWEKLLRILRYGSIEERYRMTVCTWRPEEIMALMGRYVPSSCYEMSFKEAALMSCLKRLMRVDQHTYLPDDLLTKVDRASMANGFEVRVPLLDHRVVEFSAGLPEHLLFRKGEGKYLLKQLLRKFLPENLVNRPKMGFGVPLDRWLRVELKEMMLDYLSVNTLNKEGVFNAEYVQHMIDTHLAGKMNHQYRIWALMVWQMWWERWRGRCDNDSW